MIADAAFKEEACTTQHFGLARHPINDGLAERFKLNKTVATSNLVAFDTRGQIRKYEKVEDILDEYYVYRMSMYTKRKVCFPVSLPHFSSFADS